MRQGKRSNEPSWVNPTLSTSCHLPQRGSEKERKKIRAPKALELSIHSSQRVVVVVPVSPPPPRSCQHTNQRGATKKKPQGREGKITGQSHPSRPHDAVPTSAAPCPLRPSPPHAPTVPGCRGALPGFFLPPPPPHPPCFCPAAGRSPRWESSLVPLPPPACRLYHRPSGRRSSMPRPSPSEGGSCRT